MATPNIVPRADSEGGLGTASKYWASAYIDTITTTGNVTVGGTLQVEASSSPNFQLYRSGTGQLWHFSIDSSGRFMLKEAASLGGTKNLRLQIDDDGDATFAANIALGGGAFNTTHANVTSIVNLDDNASIFTRSDLTNIGQNIYYNSSDAGAAIEDGRSTLVSLGKGTFSIHNSSASVSADAATSLQERFSIDTAGAATFAGDVTIANNDATLTLYAAASPFTPKIEFIRNSATFGDDTSTDFRLIDTGGIFKIQSGHKPSGGSIETKDLLILSENSSNPTATLVGIPFYSGPEGNSLYTHDVSATDNEGQYNAAYGFLAMDAITTGDANVAVGYKAGSAIAEGSANVAVGYEALMTEDGHGNNTAIGYRALRVQDAGADAYNTAIGFDAGTALTSGKYNTMLGGLAMGTGITTGNDNVAIGYSAGLTLTSGQKNILVGTNAGDSLTEGNHNVAIGHYALAGEDTGNNSTAIGYYALNKQNNASNNYNIAIGHGSQQENVTGVYNTAIGGLTAAAMDGANMNVLVGMQAGTGLTTASYNTVVGTFSLYKEDTRGFNTAVGYETLRFQNAAADTYSTAVGFQAARNNITGLKNTTIGGYAGRGIIAGDFNVAVGHKALYTTGAGNRSTAIGYQALQSQYTTFTETGGATTNGDQSITHTADARIVTGLAVSGTGIPPDSFVGVISSGTTFNLVDLNGSAVNATADGSSLTLTFTGGQDASNTAVGYNAGYAVTTGLRNTLIGAEAGDSVTTGIYNTAVGYAALATENISGFNTAIGYGALRSQNTTAEFGYNVAVGKDAGTLVSTGINNTIIGGLAGDALQTGSNNILIGKDAKASASDADNETVIGHTATTSALIHGAMTNRAYTGTAEGVGIDASDAVSISVGEYNSEIVTSVFVDIGAGSIISSSDAGDVIGNDGVNGAYITKLTTAVNGIVYRGEMICLEVPTTGDPDINLTCNASGTIAEDVSGEAGSSNVLVNGGVATLAAKNEVTIPSGGIQDDFIYLTHGGTTAGTYDAGKFLIRFYGAKVTGL